MLDLKLYCHPMETDEPKRGIRKFLLKRMLFIPLGIVALAATSYARQHPDWAEHVYAQACIRRCPASWDFRRRL